MSTTGAPCPLSVPIKNWHIAYCAREHNSVYYPYGRDTTTTPFLLQTHQQVLMNITAKSTKEDIINESTVIITEQDELIATLKERQFILFGIIGVLMITSVF